MGGWNPNKEDLTIRPLKVAVVRLGVGRRQNQNQDRLMRMGERRVETKTTALGVRVRI